MQVSQSNSIIMSFTIPRRASSLGVYPFLHCTLFPLRTPPILTIPSSYFFPIVLLPLLYFSPHRTSCHHTPHRACNLIAPPLVTPPLIVCAGGNHSRTSVGHSCAAGSASRNLLCNLFSGSAGVYRPSTDRVVRSHALKHAFSALKHAFFALKHPTARVALANLPCRQVLHAHLNLALSLTLTLISHCYFVVCALTSNVSVPNPNPNPRARCLMLISTATVLKVCSPLANKRCWR